MKKLFVLVHAIYPPGAVAIDFNKEYAPYLRQLWPPAIPEISWPAANDAMIAGPGIFIHGSGNLDATLATKVSAKFMASHSLKTF